MAYRLAAGLSSILVAFFLGPAPAGAVVMGSSSSLGGYTVRVVGSGHCSGVVIARRAVVTAAHCARGMRILTGGRSYRVAGVSRSVVLDDGRRAQVSGDAAILRLAEPLPFGVSTAPIGEGQGETFTIAGYGTTDERSGGGFGALHEATLVAAGPRALVDPHRQGSIGASACFGDSGGPVLRGGMLVGIVTRAAHPSPRIACGHLTRWAPVTVHGEAQAAASLDEGEPVVKPRPRKRQRRAKAEQTETSFNLFASWFAPKTEERPRRKHKQARR